MPKNSAINIDTDQLYLQGGTDIALADGGTGASDAATARSNLATASKVYIVVGLTGDSGYVTDGTADDVQIQAAMNAAGAAGGGTVFIQGGIHNLAERIFIPSNVWLKGAGKTATTLLMGSGLNKTVVGNNGISGGTANTNIRISDLTIDQQGSTQTGGFGMSFQGVSDSTIENVIIEWSFTYNLFFITMGGTTLTGTVTITNGSNIVTGTGTAFTTQLAVGSFLRSGVSSSQSEYVRKIISDTSLELDRAWGYPTATDITYKLVPPNARNRVINCEFRGNGDDDNFGMGAFDDSLIQGCVSRDSQGYGFGADHTKNLKMIGNTAYNNNNAGIALETSSYCVIADNISYGQISSNGIYLLSGSYRNTVVGNICTKNNNGIGLTYNSTTFPFPDENTIIGNVCEYNLGYGIRIDGANRTSISSNRLANNGTSGTGSGILINSSNSRVPDKTIIVGNHAYDNQDTKTQQRGIYILSGTNTQLMSNISLTADHTVAGITDSGISTRIGGEVQDINGNIALGNTPTDSSVNYVNVENSATGNAVALGAAGADGNINFILKNKGSGILALRPGGNNTNAVRIQNAAGSTTILTTDTTNTRIGIAKTTPLDTLDIGGSLRVESHAYFDAEVANTLTTGAVTIDFRNGNKQKVTLNANATLTFTAPSGPCSLSLRVIQDATGGRTVAFATTIKWPSGIVPTWSTGVNAIDVLSLYFDGSVWYGMAAVGFA